MIRPGKTVAAILWLGATASVARAAEPALPCVTAEEARGFVLYLAPDLLRQAGKTCAKALPPTATIRQTTGPLIAKYDAEAAGAWPMARLAIAKIAPLDGVDVDDMKPLMRHVMASKLKIRTQDCRSIDRVLTAIVPLPPANAADLVVTLVQLSQDKRSDGATSSIPVCPASEG